MRNGRKMELENSISLINRLRIVPLPLPPVAQELHFVEEV
jgi:hypothetical protein